MKTTHQFQIPNNFEERFGSETFAFFRQTVNDTNWLEKNIDIIQEQNPGIEEAKIVFQLGNLIGTEIIEEGLEKISDLPQAYIDILCEAVYAADRYEIAKEIYKQYINFKQTELSTVEHD